MTAVDERSRHELYLSIEALIGAEEAETLMSMLPSVGWADVATKQDLTAHEVATKRDLTALEASLRKDIGALEASLRKDIGALEASLRKDIGALEASLRKDMGALEASLRSDMAALGREFSALEAGLRQEIGALEERIELRFDSKLNEALRNQLRVLVFALIGTLFTMMSLNLTAIALLR